MPNHSKAVKTAKPERATNKARLSKTPDVNALKAKTTLGLYSLKTKDGELFGIPFCAVSDHYALLAQKQVSPLTVCYRIGSVCLFDGKVIAADKPTLVLDKGV